MLDLGTHRINSVIISRDSWSKDMPKVIAGKLLKANALDAMAVLVVHSDVDGRTLPTFLRECSPSALKKLCELLRVPIPPKGTPDVAGSCVSNIIRAVDAHTAMYSHLVNKDERFLIGNSDVPLEDEDEDDDVWPDPNTERKESDRMHGLPLRRSGRSHSTSPGGKQKPKHAQPLAAAVAAAAASSSSSSSSKQPNPSVLAAIGQLPSAPPNNSAAVVGKSCGQSEMLKKSNMRHVEEKTKKSKRSKHAKKDKKRSHRTLFSSDEDDSDSDGPSGRSFSTDDRSSSESSDSDASSSSDSDDESSRRHRKHKRVSAMEAHGLARPLAKKFIRNALASTNGRGSILDVYKEMDFKVVRNERECLSLAKAIDLARKEHWSKLLELLVRRLVGVQSADISGNWKLCDQFELVMDQQSFVPDDFLARALKNAQRLETLESSSRTRRGQDAPAASKSRAPAAGRKSSARTPAGSTNNRHRERSTDTRGPPSNSSKSDKSSKDKRDQ